MSRLGLSIDDMNDRPALVLTAVDASSLLAALPLGAAIVVIGRVILGLRPIGVFAPALLAITVLDLGLRAGVAVIASAFVTGMFGVFAFGRLAMPRIARLGLVLCVMSAGLVLLGHASSDKAVLPLVMMAVIVERSWELAAGEGWRATGRLLGTTFGLAVVTAVSLATPPMRSVLAGSPLLGIGLGAVTIVLAGSYRGLRLGERRRFRALLDSAGGPANTASTTPARLLEGAAS
jgi:hypothetical protein